MLKASEGACDGKGAIFDGIGSCGRCVRSYDKHLLREAAEALSALDATQEPDALALLASDASPEPPVSCRCGQQGSAYRMACHGGGRRCGCSCHADASPPDPQG